MIRRSAPTGGAPPGPLAMLMLAVFSVSVGYGIVLPLLPYLIDRLLGASGTAAQVARATGLLTGLYTLSLFLFAPVWGWLSDRHGRRTILLVGLIGFGVSTATAAFVDSLPAIYVERFVSGVFAAAITPVALATIGDLASTEEARARQLTLVGLAGISGFLLGPMIGASLDRLAAGAGPAAAPVGSLAVPFAGAAVLTLLVALAVAVIVPGKGKSREASEPEQTPSAAGPWVVARLLTLAFIVSAGVGVFEVGLALRGKQEMGLTQYQIALMFTECSAVMFVVQAVVFGPWIRPEATRWLIGPALAVLAAGLFLVPRATDFPLMLAVVGTVAASAGILSPILTYWISRTARAAQGMELGRQTAASSLGVTLGSAAGGLLFEVRSPPNAAFLTVTAVTLLGLLLSLALPRQLAPKACR
jgi:MFS family permease